MDKEKLKKEALDCLHEIKFLLGVPINQNTREHGLSPLLNLLESKEKQIDELNIENGKLEGFLQDEKMEYFELENFKNNEINEIRKENEKLKVENNFLRASIDSYHELSDGLSEILKKYVKEAKNSGKSFITEDWFNRLQEFVKGSTNNDEG